MERLLVFCHASGHYADAAEARRDPIEALPAELYRAFRRDGFTVRNASSRPQPG
jgi:hypothetical protein